MKLPNIKKSTVSIVLAALALLPLLPALSVSAQVDENAKKAACEGLGSVGSDCEEAEGESAVSGLIRATVEILSFIVGVAAVIMVIIGGLKYITSNGDANSISSAKNTILYAIIGLVIAVLAQGIVRFVFKRVSPDQPAEETVHSLGTQA
ncbi:MAG: pilin [Candidatus Saccharimonadales bacterium]